MKFKLLLCLLFAITANSFTTAKAQVNVNDSLALVDLYNSTNGAHWYINTNWLTSNPVSTWYGVKVTGARVTFLSMDRNNLTQSIPSSIGNLTMLSYLGLTKNNNLTGSIPSSIGNLVNLLELDLLGNQLTGSIPSSIGNLVNLDALRLFENQLSGSLPASIGKLKNLIGLYLSDNQLSGTIPDAFSNLKKLDELFLDYNQLSGNIPSSLTGLVNLSYLELSNNRFSGSIPAFIGDFKRLTELWLNDNQLSGAIPSSIANPANLRNLVLNNNQLSGSIPATIDNAVYLGYLNMSHNQLSGTIPSSLGNLKSLFYLDLSYNQLTGNIPSTFNKLEKMSYLYLDHNLLALKNNVDFLMARPSYASIYVNNNRNNFNGLEFAVNKYKYMVYSPQDTILPIHQTNNTLSVSAGGTLSNNTYNWFKVGETNPVIIKGDSTFIPSTNGNYYAKVTNAIATQLTLTTDTITYTMPVAQTQNSIANVAAVKTTATHFSIYPNPAKDIIHIQTNGNATIVLTNSLGKILLTKTINKSDAINVSAFANGVYYIQNKTTGETEKIVVSH